MGSFYDENLGWDVVPWLKVCHRSLSCDFNAAVSVVLTLIVFSWQGITKLPIILKGIQCVEDVQLAHEHGVSGVVLSNHGVRITFLL